MSKLDWEKAQKTIDMFVGLAQEVAKRPNTVMIFYQQQLALLQHRLSVGERTQELYDEIMELS